MGTKIHTVTLPNGETATRKSQSREYVACVVVERTQEANDIERAKYEAQIAEHEAVIGSKTEAEIEAEYKAWSASRRDALKDVPHFFGELGKSDFRDNPERKRIESEFRKSGKEVVDRFNALGYAKRCKVILGNQGKPGAYVVNSWHMSIAQANKTAASGSSSMAHIRTGDKVRVVTDITVRETDSKKASKPKKLTDRRSKALATIANSANIREAHIRTGPGIRKELIAMGLIEQQGEIEVVWSNKYNGGEERRMYPNLVLTDSGREALAKAEAA